MGAGIAYVSLEAGYAVRLCDRDDASLGRGLASVAGIYRSASTSTRSNPRAAIRR
jgi:3-hydroxyacyl-CoA dehydrogenase